MLPNKPDLLSLTLPTPPPLPPRTTLQLESQFILFLLSSLFSAPIHAQTAWLCCVPTLRLQVRHLTSLKVSVYNGNEMTT